MAYLPPGGGRMNVTIGSNTAGVGSLISTGTLALAGGNNITLSQNGANGLTIHGGAAGGSNTFGMSNLGNTSGTTGVVSGSALSYALAGGNNITLSQSLNGVSGTLTISAANQTAQTQSNIQAFYDGARSISTGTVSLSNANGISLGITGQTLTASHNGITSQTNQNLSLYAFGNTTQNSSTLLNASNLSFNGLGAATMGYSNGSIQVSVPTQTAQTANLYVSSNSTQLSSTAGVDLRSLSFQGAGIASVGVSQGKVLISVPSGGGAGVALANTETTYTSGTVTLSGDGQVTIYSSVNGASQFYRVSIPGTSSLSATGAFNISSNGGTISMGVPAFSAGMSNIGNTLGTSGTASNQVVFAGGNNITLSQSTNATGNTVTIQAGVISAGTQTANGSTLKFADLNGITFGMSASSQITASHNGITSQSVQTQSNIQGIIASGSTNRTGDISFAIANGVTFGLSNNTMTASVAPGGVALSASNNLFTSGTVKFTNAGGAITVGTAAQEINFSVPATSQLSATGAVSISTNGGTISIGAPQMATLSRYEQPREAFNSVGTQGQGSLSIQHAYLPFNVVMSAAKIGGSMSAGTSTAAATGSANFSLWMGIYTLSGSTLSLAASGSAANNFSWQAASSASTTNLTGISGMRQLTVPIGYTSATSAAFSATPGEYWVAAALSTAATAPGASFSVYGNSNITGGATNAVLTPIGSGTAVARDVFLFQGIYTAATSAGPASMSGGHINNYSASYVQRANYYLALYNATY